MSKKRNFVDDIIFEIKVWDRKCDKFVKRKLEEWNVPISKLPKWYRMIKKRHSL
jgi:hypothetical protein